ncbi:AAA family ATPase, partial [Veillonella seminalis]|uniref:AAA family ATPase n=1 Tax=Veillonella seminalis TaxID=1502943 RepID=UPI0023F7191B
MKKQNVLNLIKYHVEKNENAFRNEAIAIARYFDSIGDYQLAEYIMGLIATANLYTPQSSDYESDFFKQIDVRSLESLNLPKIIAEDIKGIINAINHNVGINKFLFEGFPGSGKTEAAKHIARLLERKLFIVDFENLIDSKLGQTNKNIISLFREINTMPNSNKAVILFDEIDVIALNRVDSNDIREMGRVTSIILRELDRLTDLNKEIVIIATTNLYKNFDKALIRRFDAVIDFNRYSREDLIEVAEYYFSSFIRNFKGISKDIRLFKKILKVAEKLPYPGDLKNIIKTSLAFSDVDASYDYLKRLYEELEKQCRSHAKEIYNYAIPQSWNLYGYRPAKSIRSRELLVHPYEFYLFTLRNILKDADGNWKQPQLTKEKPSDKRDWLKHASVYSLMVRTATAWDHDRDDRLVSDNLYHLNDNGTFLKSILLLPLLKRMGVNTLLLHQIFPLCKTQNAHDYPVKEAVTDFRSIDPLLQDKLVKKLDAKEQCAAFLEACHLLGFRVILEYCPGKLARE